MSVVPESCKGENTCKHVCNHFLYIIFLYQLWFDQFGGTCIVVCFSVLPSDSAVGGNIWTTSSWVHMPTGQFQARLTSTWVEKFFEQAEFVQRSAMTATVSEQEGELCQFFFLTLSMCFLHEYGPSVFAPCVLFTGRV